MTDDRQTSETNRQLAHITENLEMVTDQIGRLTEGLTDIKLTAQQQAENISRLTDNITRLVTVVDRQAQMMEKLFEQQNH